MARLLKLDRMEIIGYTSSYGQPRLKSPEGITAVVGPNGCGKSNIGDAISWVLGEQKASSLRSDRMEDVIFNGSDAKRPLGMAEVSLHFKNIGLVVDPALPVSGNGNGHGSTEPVPLTIAAADPGADLTVPIAFASQAGPLVTTPRHAADPIPEATS